MGTNTSGAGDPRHWLDEHGDALFRYALSQLRDRQSAEDLVQETFLAALKSKGSFAGGSSARTWLIGILRNKIVDEFRRRGKEPIVASAVESGDEAFFSANGKWKPIPGGGSFDPVKLAENREFWRGFEECRQHLAPPLAEAFLLREIESLDMTEICNILEITPTNLSVRLHRARLALRQCLERHWLKGIE